MKLPLESHYAALGDMFSKPAQPTPVSQPTLIRFNAALFSELGGELGSSTRDVLAQIFSGNQLPEQATPIAMAYSGHQFGHLNPNLGDGRAILLGECQHGSGQLMDVQLKGAGRTPFSRSGDGRSPMGPALREYILCEAMHALGVPTTRALAVVASGDYVVRMQREPGAVFTRVASSHMRVGSFQYLALQRNTEHDVDALKVLADHAIERHFPELLEQPHSADDPASHQPEAKYLAFFSAVAKRQANLIAQWMNLGFVHGVMNTDNMTISGETIDYGPCAFIDAFQRNAVFSSIDTQGRYAYQNQPAIGQWNLARLAEALLPLFSDDESVAVELATDVLKRYSDWHQHAWEQGMAHKLGLLTPEPEPKPETNEPIDTSAYGELFTRVIDLLDASRLDFTLFFRRLAQCVTGDFSPVLALYKLPESTGSEPHRRALSEWLQDWHTVIASQDAALTVQQMQAANPARIPRNHQVAAVIRAAEDGDFAPFHALVEALSAPYTDDPQLTDYELPPTPEQKVLRTFCGT